MKRLRATAGAAVRFGLTVALTCASSLAGTACIGSGDDSMSPPPPATKITDSGGDSTTDAPAESGSSADVTSELALVEAGGEAEANTPAGGAAMASFFASPIAFGSVGCGAAGTQTFTIANEGSGQLVVSAATTGTAFSVSPGMLSVASQSSGVLTVSATLPGSAVQGTALSGSLNIFTNDPSHSMASIPLSVTPSGAVIELQQVASSIAFPTTAVGVPAATQTVTLINSGTASVMVNVGAPANPEFTLTGMPSGGVTLGVGQTWSGTAGFTPQNTSLVTTTAPVTVTGTTCAGGNLTAISFSGQGAVGQVTGWPTAPIDFGPAACGGQAPAKQSFTLSDFTGVAAHITNVDSSNAGGFVVPTDLVGQVIPAQGSLAIPVGAPPVPSPSALTPITGSVSITTDADKSAHTVTFQEEPQGAVLAFDTHATPNFGSFGPVVLVQSATQNFSVTNTGNGPADVALVAALNSADAGAPASGDASLEGGADATVDAVAAASGPPPPYTLAEATFTLTANTTQTDSVTFEPTAANALNGAITLTATGAICGATPAPVPLSGVGLGGGPSIGPTSLDFQATCGGSAPGSLSFTVSNNGSADLTWTMGTVTGPGASIYTVTGEPDGGSQVLIPGASTTVTVAAPAVASPAAVADPSELAAQIVINTDVPFDPPHVILLDEIPVGDQLSLSTSAPLRFGQVPIGQSTGAETFTVTNNANVGSPAASFSLMVNGTGAAGYSVSPLTVTNLAPGGGVTGAEDVTFTPAMGGPYPATIAISTTDALCTPLPSPIQLTGTGTQGQVVVSTSTIAFGTDPSDTSGMVNCGATGLPHTFTVTNVGNQSFEITGLTLGLGTSSPYTLSGPGAALPVTLAIAGSTTITVTPTAIPAAVANPNDATPFTDTLTIATNAAGDSPHTVSLVMQARGAVIAPSSTFSTTWAFGTIGPGVIGTITSTIQNTGNATASLALNGLAQPTIFGLRNNPTTVAAGGVTQIVGQFSPPSADGSWNDQATLVVTATQAFCEPLPSGWNSPTITLTGSSNSNPPVSYSGSLAFPTTDCGSSPPAAQNITLLNNTNQAFAFTTTLQSGVYYKVTSPAFVDAGVGTLPGSGSATLVVTPAAVTPGPGVTPGASPYADNLLVNVTTIPADGGTAMPMTSLAIPISWALNGAVLSLPSGAGTVTETGTSFYPADSMSGFKLPISNSGNGTATVNLTVNPSGVFTFSPAPPISVAPGIVSAPILTSGAGDVACPTTLPGTLTTGSVSFSYTGPVCEPINVASVNVYSCVGTFPSP